MNDVSVLTASLRAQYAPEGFTTWRPHGSPSRRNEQASRITPPEKRLDEVALRRLEVAVAEVRRSMNSVPQELQGDIADRISLAAELLHPASVSYTPSFNRDLVRSPLTSSRGGLAPWQTRKLRAFIDSNLDARISVNNLADLAGLSPSHFSRAFRTSFGKAPKAYVMLKRVTRAQELMLSCSSPLGQIAADCGLADQAHLTKLFFRFIGATPGAWRRAHRNGLPKAAGE